MGTERGELGRKHCFWSRIKPKIPKDPKITSCTSRALKSARQAGCGAKFVREVVPLHSEIMNKEYLYSETMNKVSLYSETMNKVPLHSETMNTLPLNSEAGFLSLRASTRERIFIELMTSDRKLEASREGSR